MKITIYGAGYVGLVTAACLAELDHRVLCLDINTKKINDLNAGKIPFYEPDLADLVSRNMTDARLMFASDLAEGVAYGEVLFICVGTPSHADGSANLAYIYDVAEVISEHIVEYRLIVNKSTVPVGTTLKLKQLIADRLRARTQKIDFAVVSNPEFLREGSAVYDFMHPDRIIVGSDLSCGTQVMQQIYAPLCSERCPLLLMDIVSAELSKYAANAMLATRISFINEMANIAERTGADIKHVERAIACDPRIGKDYIVAGCGYGGSCFPKDMASLIHIAAQVDYSANFLQAVQQTNDYQQGVLFTKIARHFNHDLRGRTFALWGLAFKPNTDDMRAASSHKVITALWSTGARVQAYDPAAMPTAHALYGQRDDLQLCDSPQACLDNADALIVVTEWEQFHHPDFALLKATLKQAVIFDGRNIYQPALLAELGIKYYGIGFGYS